MKNNGSKVIGAESSRAEDLQARAEMQYGEMRAAILAGLVSGPGRSASAVIDRLEKKYRKLNGKRPP